MERTNRILFLFILAAALPVYAEKNLTNRRCGFLLTAYTFRKRVAAALGFEKRGAWSWTEQEFLDLTPEIFQGKDFLATEFISYAAIAKTLDEGEANKLRAYLTNPDLYSPAGYAAKKTPAPPAPGVHRNSPETILRFRYDLRSKKQIARGDEVTTFQIGANQIRGLRILIEYDNLHGTDSFVSTLKFYRDNGWDIPDPGKLRFWFLRFSELKSRTRVLDYFELFGHEAFWRKSHIDFEPYYRASDAPIFPGTEAMAMLAADSTLTAPPVGSAAVIYRSFVNTGLTELWWGKYSGHQLTLVHNGLIEFGKILEWNGAPDGAKFMSTVADRLAKWAQHIKTFPQMPQPNGRAGDLSNMDFTMTMRDIERVLDYEGDISELPTREDLVAFIRARIYQRFTQFVPPR